MIKGPARWLLGIPAAALLLGVAAAAVSAAEPFDCTPRLQARLHFSIDRLRGHGGHLPFAIDRISDRNAIASGSGADYRLLAAELETATVGLSDEQKLSCRALAEPLLLQLESFFGRRLDSLLAAGRVDDFFGEYQQVFARWNGWHERHALSLKFKIQEDHALPLIYGRLQKRLSGTRWSGFVKVAPTVVRWSDEWMGILGREAPGAALFEERRIALQVAGLEPIEVEVFLFHELAHLSDPRVLAAIGISAYDAELWAWQETLDYLTFLKGEGIEVSPLLKRIEASIYADPRLTHEQNLSRWVTWVVASRAPIHWTRLSVLPHQETRPN